MTRSGKRWLRTLALSFCCWLRRGSPTARALFWARRSHLTDLISAMLPPDWGMPPNPGPAAGYGADVRHRHGAGIVSGALLLAPCARKISMPPSRSGGRCGCWCRRSAPSLR